MVLPRLATTSPPSWRLLLLAPPRIEDAVQFRVLAKSKRKRSADTIAVHDIHVYHAVVGLKRNTLTYVISEKRGRQSPNRARLRLD